MTDPSTRPLFPDPASPALEAPSGAAADDTRQIAAAMALLWTFRPRTAVCKLLSSLEARRHDGRAYTQDDVGRAIGELRAQGSLIERPGRAGFWRLDDRIRGPLYREVLDAMAPATLREALRRVDSIGTHPGDAQLPLYDAAEAIGLLRLELFSGASAAELGRLRSRIQRTLDWNEVLQAAAFPAFDAALFARVTPQWRWELAFVAVCETAHAWRADLRAVCDWALTKLDTERDEMPAHLRLALTELLLHRGDADRAREALGALKGGSADALRACLLVQAGRWNDAQVAFVAAIKLRQAEVGARKRIFPVSITWLYPLALLAQQTPKHLDLARKFCLGEAGTRTPSPFDDWGRWANAIGSRLGDAALEPGAFALRAQSYPYTNFGTLWTLLLAAWLGRDALRPKQGDAAQPAAVAACADALRQRLVPCHLDWLVAQVDAAEAVLAGKAPAAPFFVSGPREQWRDVLSALQVLGAGPAVAEPGVEATRILWAIRMGKDGALEAIEPFEQKRGPRGFGKPKPLGLAKIAGSERLPPWDAKVARTIRKEREYSRAWTIDRAAAIIALVGHPAVVLAGAPEQVVDLIEGTPEVEVTRDGDRFVLRVTPAVRAAEDPDARYYVDAAAQREAEALRMITLVADTPQRLRVIRLSAAQRRAAQLVSGSLCVPAAGHDELQHTLRALASHFDVHADHAEAGREVAAEARLRAELAPVGDKLMLRLVVAPLGADGPRVAPARGRTRLMAAIGGETVGTGRDLDAERAHLDAVLDALPYLDEAAGDAGGCEWLIADPEHALDAVETLPKLPAVLAVDWPKGKPVRVMTLDTPQLGIVVRSQRHWFQLQGRAAVDESTVIDFETLLAAGSARSRFVPIGDGVYVALTRSLKQRLAQLAKVAEIGREGVRVPRLAAAWLDEVLDTATVDADGEFRAAIERLHRAQDESAAVPRALQTDLRNYQEDGFRWAMRLASAGLGGCLADDMGLGKTLQGLAVLLARGAGGPALIVAPTSVCGNWHAEAQRFAPTLGVALYGESERDAMVAAAGPMDVIIVSYTLLQQAQQRFASRVWHTVIADEAQAIKNAAAKRSQAVFELESDFRLALTGTPVENRLADLWSIMRFANPGLLGTLPRFNARFAGPIERDRDRDAQHLLKRLIGPFVLRRTKAQVLQELPPRTELVVALAPGPAEAAHYEALRRRAVADADRALSTEPAGQARLNILAQLTRLRRAACDPRLVSPEFGVAGAKLQAFADLAADLVANGHKALVFSQFVDFLTLLRQPLDAAGIAYQYLDGGTPAAERTRRVAAFQAGEGELFLISLKAGGLGLNLTAADYVLITDPWWNPAAEDQAMGRAHRIGQGRPVTVYRLVTKGSIEEQIVLLHQDKRALAESILAEGDMALLPSTEDLVALIRGE